MAVKYEIKRIRILKLNSDLITFIQRLIFIILLVIKYTILPTIRSITFPLLTQILDQITCTILIQTLD
jgi:hypothetical protein